MTIATKTYTRKPFEVEAVQVNADNQTEVAEWCKGEVKEGHIMVPMSNGRAKPAFFGDWILWSRNNFRVYNSVAFENCFQEGVVLAPDPNQSVLFRDAGTGEFVTEEYAAAHAETTVKETV